MSRGKIFISHSTKTDEGRAFLDAVKSALEKKYEVLLDQTGLQPGDNWRAKIYQWIDDAHGAVLLFTPEALRSTFVQIEASILSWRSFQQPEFVFLPVLVGAVTPTDLQSKVYGELAINSVQVIIINDPHTVAKKVVKALDEKLKSVAKPRTASEILIDLVIWYLQEGGARPKVLRELGTVKFGWSERRVPGSHVACYETFARDLLDADTLVAFDVVEQLSQRGLSGAQDLLNLIAPSWVKKEEAKPVAELAMSGDSKRAFALDGRGRWARNSYIGRACARPLRHGLDLCELNKPQVEEKQAILADFKRQIIEHFTIKGEYAEDDDEEEVKRQIEELSKTRPVFVVFSPDLLSYADLVPELRKEFKTATFFILTGNAHPDQLRPLRDKLDMLNPVDRARETETRVRHDQVSRGLK